MKIGMETLQGLRYKITFWAIIHIVTNLSIQNIQKPESTFKKKGKSFANIYIRGLVANDNQADLAKKIIAN